MSNYSHVPLISVAVQASGCIEKLDVLLDSINQQTHRNVEILISGGSIQGPQLIHYLRNKQTNGANVKYLPLQDDESVEKSFLSLMGKATGEFFVCASGALRWRPDFLERCVAEIGAHGSVMSGVRVSGQVITMPQLGGERSRRLDLLEFLRYPTSAILLGVHRTSWIKSFVDEAATSSKLDLTLLRSVYRGHHRVFTEELCVLDGLNCSDTDLMPSWFEQGIKDLHMAAESSEKSMPRRGSLLKTCLFALIERAQSVVSRKSAEKFDQPEALEGMRESFSQSGEDMIIDFVFRAIQVAHPTYLDIGAHHPRLYSNTHYFYRKGSRGVNVEADPALFSRFVQERASDINLNIGVGVGIGDMCVLPFYIMSVPTLNTFSKEEADRCVAMGTHQIVNVIDVPLREVNDIILEYFAGDAPDFISIDVEGLDFEIVRSIDLHRYRPTLICVETIMFSENLDGKKTEEIEDYLQEHGYFLYADTRINSIFVDKTRWARQ